MNELRRVATGLRFPEGPVWMNDGSVIVVEIKSGTLAKVAPDGTVSEVAKTGGRPDGSSIKELIYPLDHPTGISLSPAGDRLYAAETITGRLWAWDLEAPGVVKPTAGGFAPGGGVLHFDFPGYQLLDSMGVDSDGNI